MFLLNLTRCILGGEEHRVSSAKEKQDERFQDVHNLYNESESSWWGHWPQNMGPICEHVMKQKGWIL